MLFGGFCICVLDKLLLTLKFVFHVFHGCTILGFIIQTNNQLALQYAQSEGFVK